VVCWWWMSKKSKQVRIITMYNIKNTQADFSTSPRSQQQQELNSGDNNSNKKTLPSRLMLIRNSQPQIITKRRGLPSKSNSCRLLASPEEGAGGWAGPTALCHRRRPALSHQSGSRPCALRMRSEMRKASSRACAPFSRGSQAVL